MHMSTTAVAASVKPPNRRPHETIDLTLMDGAHKLALSFGFDPKTGEIIELFFTERGKIGQGMDAMLSELALKISRLIQGRDPETGECL